MVMRAYVDDSGGKGLPNSRHFVLAGLVSSEENWANFSSEWAYCLRQSPAIDSFKMREAASCSGQFFGVSQTSRDNKLRDLCRIINRNVGLLTYSVIDLEAHAETWGTHNEKPRNEPYFFPFHNTILSVCLSLYDSGWREPFEIVFDEDVVFGPRAKAWYPIMLEIVKLREPMAANLMPKEPKFRSDDDALPIQACDLFAWCLRRGTDDPNFRKFEWLLDEMKNLRESKYSQYYDRDRMNSVTDMTRKIVSDGAVPPELVDTMRKTLGLK